MGSKKRQKLDRANNAAYAASQPLFDALRNATDSIAEQTAHLAKARDITQTVHAKIVNGDHDRHAEYMDSVVKAWKSATDTYCAIFEELVSITAAEPTEGREAGKRHLEFAALLDTAKRAKNLVEKYDSIEKSDSEDEGKKSKAHELVKIKKEPVSENEDDEEPASVVNTSGKRPIVIASDEEKPQANIGQSLLSEKVHYNKTGTKMLWEKGELKVPLESLNADERKAWDIISKRKGRKHTHSVRKANAFKSQEKQDGDAKAAETNEDTKKEPEEKAQDPSPAVEFEDVTTQVEARLKAKAEKKAAEKAARKAERKRKRESGDSFVTKDPEESDPEPQKVPEPLEVSKPAKKKSKKSRSDEPIILRSEKAAEPDIEPAVDSAQSEKKDKKEKEKKESKAKEKKRKEAEVEDESATQQAKKRKKVKCF